MSAEEVAWLLGLWAFGMGTTAAVWSTVSLHLDGETQESPSSGEEGLCSCSLADR